MKIRFAVFFLLCMLSVDMLHAGPMTPYPVFEFEGAYDYFILSKSLLADTADYSDYEPQGDTSLGVEGTTATLGQNDVPEDALVEKVLLVWFASIDSSDSQMMTDNEVTLIAPDGTEHVVRAELQGNSATPPGLVFEAYYKNGYYYYVYRVDVTALVKDYQMSSDDGSIVPLTGEWTVKGVDDIWDCGDDENHNYCNMASMVGGWQMLIVYGSDNIARKRLYFYHGLDWSSNTMMNAKAINVTDFELPESASIKVSFVTMDGDDYPQYPESLEMIGELASQNLVLGEVGNDACNPLDQPFNSKFRTYNHKGEASACREELSFDADTFMLAWDEENPDSIFNPHLQAGTTWFNFFIKTGSDIILTNYVMLSVDTKLPAFDIPEENEKRFMSQSDDPERVCSDRAFAYEIRVENHGKEPAENVVVTDPVPAGTKYVAGSTQIDRTGTGTCYEPVEDVSGESPIENGITVADELPICHGPDDCERVLVRFKVEPQNPMKNSVYRNNATIHDDISGKDAAYRTNQGLPVFTPVDMDCAETIVDPYTPESTACGGEVPDKDEQPDAGSTAIDDESHPDDSAELPDGGTDSDGTSGSVEDESGCGCTVIMQ